MTQVWMIRNSDTDIHVFNRRDHLLPSVECSYCNCQDVEITSKWIQGTDNILFEITGKRNDEKFTDHIIAYKLPVWTEPCHL